MVGVVQRVERDFLLDALVQSQVKALVQFDGHSLSALFSSLEPKAVILESAPPIAENTSNAIANMYFDFRGQSFTCSSRVLDVRGNKIFAELPDSLYSSPARGWPRILQPKKLAAKMLIPGYQAHIPCPTSEEYYFVDPPATSFGYTSNSVNGLLAEFKKDIIDKVGTIQITTFKDNKPTNIIESIVAHTGLTLYVPATNGKVPTIDPYKSSRIITSAYLEARKNQFTDTDIRTLELLLEHLAESKITSALWCPIRFLKYTIGVIQIFNNVQLCRTLAWNIVDAVWEFSCLLSWHLKTTSPLKSVSNEVATIDLNIRNMSESGFLALIPTSEPQFPLASKIKIQLLGKSGTMECEATISRRFKMDENLCYGFELHPLEAAKAEWLSQELYGCSPDTLANIRGKA